LVLFSRQILAVPHSRSYSSKFEIPIFKPGSDLEFESKVH
jgi:hypothetical protein